ncbi:HAD-IC family P-type ATPase [Candidatus Saccharibacteria bacterium]|nr:HAD-IC family P-type ATPase [Candidatus Saccharibacteria bacterium]
MKHPYLRIVAKHTFTLFNLVNVILAAMVAFVGSYKNMLFIFIAIANTLISIINEVRAAKIVEKMRLLSEQNPTIIKNGQPVQVTPEEVAKGDILVLSLGDQIMYDSVVEEGQIEVNESFITGEQDNISKKPGDELVSGSFVVSGTAKAKVEHALEDNFINKLQNDASAIKTADSKLFILMNKIVKYISYALIPVGALLLWSRFRAEADTATAITSTVAALINMIPEGLILLTSSVLALATIRLSKKNVLVQDLYSTETLARVDCICLDKTGTLTTGKMTVHDFILPDGTELENPSKTPTPAEKSFLTALEAILSNQLSENATTKALKQKFLKTAKNRVTAQNVKNAQISNISEIGEITDIIAFSSDRKCSGIKTKTADYLMGAVEFITDDKDSIKWAKSQAGDYRVLALSKNQKLLGIVRLEDEIRHDANEIINYFYDNDVAVKIISGDDLSTVQNIAKKVGVRDLSGIDLSTEKRHDYSKLVKDYSIFTRVKPAEKKSLVQALKKQGFTVAMTGDGVNDILAMKEADVSLAIGDGADAARRAAKMVLLDSDYAAVPAIIDEGRQSINNLERSTALFLTKTVYASILAVVFVLLPFSYPYSPIEMTLLNFTCIGFPGLILALEHNTERIKNRFTRNIMEYSIPIGITVSICMLALSITSHFQNFSRYELTTTSVFVTFAINLLLIYRISRPLNKLRKSLLLTVLFIMLIVFVVPFSREFFEFTFLTEYGLIATIVIIVFGVILCEILRKITKHISAKYLTDVQP